MLVAKQNIVRPAVIGKLRRPRGKTASANRIKPPMKTSRMQICRKSKSDNMLTLFSTVARKGSPMMTNSARTNNN